jgi:hypothetical protein
MMNYKKDVIRKIWCGRIDNYNSQSWAVNIAVIPIFGWILTPIFVMCGLIKLTTNNAFCQIEENEEHHKKYDNSIIKQILRIIRAPRSVFVTNCVGIGYTSNFEIRFFHIGSLSTGC